jgi:hypothetical protein
MEFMIWDLRFSIGEDGVVAAGRKSLAVVGGVVGDEGY